MSLLYTTQSHQLNAGSRSISRARTPNGTNSQTGPQVPVSDGDTTDQDPRTLLFNDLYARSEARLDSLFNGETVLEDEDEETEKPLETQLDKLITSTAAGRILEDDYDDYEDEDSNASPLKGKSSGTFSAIPTQVASPGRVSAAPPSPALTGTNGVVTQASAKGAEDALQQMEAAKRKEEQDARQSFSKYYWTLDNDRLTMLEQQRLEESERQLDVEMSGQAQANEKSNLASANLGASSLVLQHLLRRIDAKRELVKASDQQLRALLVEVKKNRSKWASEERIGQEDLYESAERVLNDLKSNTTHSSPFLSRVKQKDAPDYYNIIKEPMDLGLMTKKLKMLSYKSKQDFCYDLNLIWANCKRYNDKPGHFLRKHADEMERMAQRLIPLIPDITIRDRAEVEAEERRAAAAEGAEDAAEESDDDQPIIASRGRKATSKKARKGGSAPQVPDSKEDTPAAEVKPVNGLSGIRKDFLRADSDTAMEGSQSGGLNTPPPGTLTPNVNGVGAGSQVDAMEIDNLHESVHGALGQPEIDYDDHEYKIWKQVTKKDRATITAERHRLFKDDKLNPDEPALLRNRVGMRHWLQKHREGTSSTTLGKRKRTSTDDGEKEQSNETLADGLEETEDRILPDYYDTMSAVPDIIETLQWNEDSEGFVVPGCDETLRLIPSDYFRIPMGTLSGKMAANMRQVQETRKICAKIGVVKQMQLQSQLYQSQFQKYDPEPLVDQDVGAHVVSDDGPVMTPYVCRAAMQRSVGRIFLNAGFEEYQPSAIDAMTDLATDFMVRIGRTISDYMERPKVASSADMKSQGQEHTLRSKHTLEEALLLSLNANGLDLEGLETYAKEDADKFGAKLSTMHERMKAHLSDLLRPALAADAGPDGVNAFNDGSEQFVGGDFAEDLGEDFFGFKELGLDKEFGLAGLSVPLHLLHNRMHRNYQAQSTNVAANAVFSYPTPSALEPVTSENYRSEIGLFQSFLQAKLVKNHNQPLVEDEDLPQKQRLPKPRLPPNGKITSPRKRPVKELGPGKGHPKKKMRFIEGEGWIKESEVAERERQRQAAKVAAVEPANEKPGSKLKQSMTANDFDDNTAVDEDDMDITIGDSEKKKIGNGFGDGGMMSPESLEA